MTAEGAQVTILAVVSAPVALILLIFRAIDIYRGTTKQDLSTKELMVGEEKLDRKIIEGHKQEGKVTMRMMPTHDYAPVVKVVGYKGFIKGQIKGIEDRLISRGYLDKNQFNKDLKNESEGKRYISNNLIFVAPIETGDKRIDVTLFHGTCMGRSANGLLGDLDRFTKFHTLPNGVMVYISNQSKWFYKGQEFTGNNMDSQYPGEHSYFKMKGGEKFNDLAVSNKVGFIGKEISGFVTLESTTKFIEKLYNEGYADINKIRGL